MTVHVYNPDALDPLAGLPSNGMRVPVDEFFASKDAQDGDAAPANVVSSLKKSLDRLRIGLSAFVSSGTMKVHEPPTDLFVLAELLTLNTWHSLCVEKVSSVIANDWLLIPADESKKAADLDASEETLLREFCQSVNSDQDDIAGVVKQVSQNVRGLGNGYMEVVRDRAGRPAELRSLPAVTMRVAADKPGFWQFGRLNSVGLIPSFSAAVARKFYKRFGDKARYDSLTGELGGAGDATEIIHVKTKHPASQIYGVPWWLPAILEMEADRAAGRYNATFFRSNTMPRRVIIFAGDQLTPEGEKRFQAYFEMPPDGEVPEGRNHRPLLLAMDNPEGAVHNIPLEATEVDGSFLKLRVASRDHIVAAHGVPLTVLGIPVSSGMSLDNDTARQDFKSLSVEPEQRAYETILNTLIVPLLGIEDWIIKLVDFDLSNSETALSKAREMRSLVGVGVITINEARVEIGYKPVADVPAADRLFVQTSSGPLFLDTVGDGVPQGTPPAKLSTNSRAEGLNQQDVLDELEAVKSLIRKIVKVGGSNAAAD